MYVRQVLESYKTTKLNNTHTTYTTYTHTTYTHLFTILGQLNSKTTTGGGFSYSSFPSHKDPLKSLLVDDVLKRWFREITVVKISHGEDRLHCSSELCFVKRER
jgi:hypothetical protein